MVGDRPRKPGWSSGQGFDSSTLLSSWGVRLVAQVAGLSSRQHRFESGTPYYQR